MSEAGNERPVDGLRIWLDARLLDVQGELRCAPSEPEKTVFISSNSLSSGISIYSTCRLLVYKLRQSSPDSVLYRKWQREKVR